MLNQPFISLTYLLDMPDNIILLCISLLCVYILSWFLKIRN